MGSSQGNGHQVAAELERGWRWSLLSPGDAVVLVAGIRPANYIIRIRLQARDLHRLITRDSEPTMKVLETWSEQVYHFSITQ